MARFQFIKDLSIKNKIITIILFVTFTAISIGFIFITIRDIKRLNAVTQSQLSLDATLIGDYCIVPLTFGNKQQAEEALSRLKYIQSVDEGYLFDKSGKLFASYPDSLTKPAIKALGKIRSATYKDGYFLITELISFDSEPIGTLYLKANSKILVKETQKLGIVLAIVFLVMLIISYLLALRLQKLFTKPILKLADMTAAISKNQDFTLQLEPYGKDEIGSLYMQFNNLLAQLLKKQNERENAEKEISFLAQALRNTNEYVCITDLDNNITYVNHAWRKNFGYKNEEAIGKKIDIVVSAGNRHGIIEEIHAGSLKGGWKGEILNRRKDGSEFPVFLSTSIMYDAEKQPIALVGISSDMTERKKAEEKIKVSEKQLSLIYSNVYDAIYFLSVEPDNCFRFLSVNHTFLVLTGLTEDQIVNKLVHEIIPEPSLSFVIENYSKAINAKTSIQWEEETEYPTGKKIGLVSITPLFDSSEKCINLVGTVHDITERKHAEEELKLHRDHLEELVKKRTAELEIEKEHAQSADHLKSAFLATMSHELRTPLNSIIGFSGILMQERPGTLNDEQKKQLGMVQNSARHLLSLINDVLDISKIEAGQLKMNVHAFNLPDLIYKVADIIRPFADKKNLRIMLSVDENISEIISDELRVKQILLNLVNNAIKFTEVGSISLKCYSEGDFVKMEISDTGMGIESDKIELLFKPFMQVDTGLTRTHEGTGLGLSICKKLTEMLNGKIEVESEYGSGSTFTVTLPIIKT